MSLSSTIQPINQSNGWVSFDINGNPDDSNLKEDIQLVALHADKYYAQWNRLPFRDDKGNGTSKGLGPGLMIALFETVTASLLQYLEGTPATFTNLCTTLGELAQVTITNVTAPRHNLNDIKDEKVKRSEIKKQRFLKALRENAISTVIAGAGVLGLHRWAKEMVGTLKGEEVEVADLSLPKKFALSIASFLSSVGMFLGYSEKVSFAPIAKNGGERAKEMRSNGKSDSRCSIEWLLMTAFPFLVEIKPAKAIIDFVLPAAALLDGVGDLYEWVHGKFNDKVNGDSNEHHVGCNHDHHHNHDCNHGFTGLINNGLGLIRKGLGIKKDGKKAFEIPRLFFNKLFFGSRRENGIRSRILNPLYKLVGCEPPECYVDNDRLFVKVPKKAVVLKDGGMENKGGASILPMLQPVIS